MRPVGGASKANAAYRTREHLTEVEMAKLLDALKRNRHGDRDRLIGLLIFRHGLRVSEACDLRWDDIDLSKRTIIVRRLKGSTDSSHYLEKDEHRALGDLRRTYAKKGIKSAYVFVNERNQPFGRMDIAKNDRAGRRGSQAAFPGTCAHAATFDGIRPGRLVEWIRGASSTTSGTPQSRIQFATRRCRQSRSMTGADFCWPVRRIGMARTSRRPPSRRWPTSCYRLGPSLGWDAFVSRGNTSARTSLLVP